MAPWRARAETKARTRERRVPGFPAVDAAFLDQLARRLADAYGLTFAQAMKHVRAVAVSGHSTQPDQPIKFGMPQSQFGLCKIFF